MKLKPDNPWMCFRGSFRIPGNFRESIYVEAFVEASVDAFVEASASGILFPWKL